MKLRSDFKKINLESGKDSKVSAPGEDPGVFFLEQSRLDILDCLDRLVYSEDDFQNYQGVLLLGNKGIGKTSLIREFVDFHAEKLNINVALVDAGDNSVLDSPFSSGRNHNSGSVTNSELEDSSIALFSSILKSFGLSDYQCDNTEIFQKSFMDIARYSRECGRSTLVIIDNAHRLSSEIIYDLLCINNACYQKGSPVYWIFSSEPGLERVFDTLSQKHKNLGIEHGFSTLRLHAFNLEDTERFVNFKCDQAGISGVLNLKPSDIESVYNASQGNPGLIPNVISRVLQNSNSPKNIIVRIPRVHRMASLSVAISVGLCVAISAFFDNNVEYKLFPWGALERQALGVGASSTEIKWFLEQNPQVYTIQLISGVNVGNIDQYMLNYKSKVGNNKLYKFKASRDGKDWYLVFCGMFKDKESAFAFRHKLPESMKTTGPWVRSFQQIQQEFQHKIDVSLVNQ